MILIINSAISCLFITNCLFFCVFVLLSDQVLIQASDNAKVEKLIKDQISISKAY